MKTKHPKSKRTKTKRPKAKWNERQANKSQVEYKPSANESQVTLNAKWIEDQVRMKTKWNLTMFCKNGNCVQDFVKFARGPRSHSSPCGGIGGLWALVYEYYDYVHRYD